MYGFLLIEDIKNAPIKRATLLIRLVAHFFRKCFFYLEGAKQILSFGKRRKLK